MFCLACFTWVKVWFLLQDPREVRQNKLLYIGSETSPKASHMFSLLPAIICLIALVICYLNFFHRSNWERKHVDRNQCPHQMSIIFVLATFGWKKWDFRFLSCTFYRSHFYFLSPMSHFLCHSLSLSLNLFVLESILSTWAPPGSRLLVALVNCQPTNKGWNMAIM